MSIVARVWSGDAISISIPIPIGVHFMLIAWLGALLYRVSTLRSLPRLDSSYLVDVDLSLWRVLDVDVNQGWVEGHLLIGQWQSIHRVGGSRSGTLEITLLVAVGHGSGRSRGGQVAKLPC